jgi:hypothetical protein
VCRNIYPLAALLSRGFQPVRFKALADDTTVVAQSTYDADKDALAGKTRNKEPSAAHSRKRKARH